MRVQKQLFRNNPTYLHRHPMYNTIHQYVTTISNIVQTYTKPTLNLHKQLCISHNINNLHHFQIFFALKTYHFHHLHQAFMKDTENIISTYTLSSFMIYFKLYIIHYKLLFFRIKMQKVCRFSVGLV